MTINGMLVKAAGPADCRFAEGFDPDHKDINLLRLRNYTVSQKLKDDDVIGRKGLERIVYLVSCLVPFITYLNTVVMPDDPTDDDSSGDGAEGDSDGTDEGSSDGGSNEDDG